MCEQAVDLERPRRQNGFAAVFEVDADQILRMAVFHDREAALDTINKRQQQPV